jgi:DNA-binding MarR family transcriptional regulator
MNDNMTTATHMFDHSKKLAEAYEKVMQPLCKKLDMPKTALDVLMFLANNPEFNTAGDVCRYRNIKAALVSFHVEKLVEAGFVERQAVKGDRRKCRLVCTKKAQPVIKEGRELQKKFAQKLIAGFSDDDMAHFKKCLHIVSNNIDSILKECM